MGKEIRKPPVGPTNLSMPPEKLGQHRHAHSAQQQVNERGNSGQLGAQHHGRQRDGEGLHGHGHTQRHGDGDLCHHGDDGGKQARVADIAHRELTGLIHRKNPPLVWYKQRPD